MLVASKSDLSDERVVTAAYALEKMNELECDFYVETSSWTDLASIKGLFQRITDELVRRKIYSTKQGSTLQNR